MTEVSPVAGGRTSRRVSKHAGDVGTCVPAVPFAGVGRVFFGRLGFQPWDKNPNLCRRCITSLTRQEVSGADEASFLFADVRRSSDLARSLGTMEFTRLMQRFYAAAPGRS
jgi:hypothetical protein